MNHTEQLTLYVSNFIDELSHQGIDHIVISPGSRSTPLAMTIREHKEIKSFVIVDERSAAFFALGIAKTTGRPTALVCTSGTAAANYFPAIVEAYYSRVPLIVLTADRPHELRDTGAPQSIDQIKLYGDYVKWFHEMALPEGSEEMLHYARNQAVRAVYEASEGNKGPVHLNFPFREPLTPDFTLPHLWGERKDTQLQSFSGQKELTFDQIEKLYGLLQNKQKGVIVCGPQVDNELAPAIAHLAEAFELPILADPISQLRSGSHPKDHIIEGYDAILRSKEIRQLLKADFIIRFGAMPVSKSYLFYINEHNDIMQFVVEPHAGSRDPTMNASTFIYADPISLCQMLSQRAHSFIQPTGWLSKWQQMNEQAKKILRAHENEGRLLTEGEAVLHLFQAMPSKSTLYVGNSMAIRDVDTFFFTTDNSYTILANRGVNGIDGLVSSGLGAAATAYNRVTLLLGDLSFYHDLNGLLTAKQYDLNMTILLINNNGGGIFSFLPQAANEKHFEPLFGTPLNIDFRHAVQMYGGYYTLAHTKEDLKAELKNSYSQKGLYVVEVQTDRAENVCWRKNKWETIINSILEGDFGAN